MFSFLYSPTLISIHDYWKNHSLTRQSFVGKVISLLLNMLSRLVIWRRQWHPTPVLLPGKSHGQRSLVGCSPWGRWESDTTERLHFHFSLSCIGEGNGNPFQCSCLENPRDGGAWWAAVYGVTQSRTRLKRLSSSSSNRLVITNLPVKLVAHYHSLELYFVLQVSGAYWLRAQTLKSDYLDLNPNSATYQPWDPW